MKTNYEKVFIYRFPLPEGSPPIVTGYYFRPTLPETEYETVGDPGLLDRLLASAESGPQGGQDGGAKVPAPKPPKAPTPISGVAKPLPKILVP